MHLMLFGTSGCHLCEQAEEIINACVPDGVETVDIAEQKQWQEQYALRIPILYDSETQQELGWPFDQSAVEEFVGSVEEIRDDRSYKAPDSANPSQATF